MSLNELASVIRHGLPGPPKGARELLEALFGERYHKRHAEDSMFRDAFALAGDEKDGVPYAGLINPDNPSSGPYGGASLAWFPTENHGSLIALVVGTRGLSPDEGILMRPGHRRRVAALRRYLARMNVQTWTKPDPAGLGVDTPKVVEERFTGFERVFKRYGHELYCIAVVPNEEDRAYKVVQAFFDLYAWERGWNVQAVHKEQYETFRGALMGDLFAMPGAATVNALLRQRRFVILQGPPGTGKTRMADEIRLKHFGGHGMTVQFHPAVTYEDFVVGLSPDPTDKGLRFTPKPGWLVSAAQETNGRPYVLVIDEINRADLGKVLGEAIYLFEAAEVGGENARKVKLAQKVNGLDVLELPANLYVLGTMNTADRSIAGLDLAVRRRFAFVTLMPDRSVIEKQDIPLATQTFDRLSEVFIEHAPDDALELLPGHSYFLASNERDLRTRFRHELLPLIDDYLRQGFLGPATAELHAVRDVIADEAAADAKA